MLKVATFAAGCFWGVEEVFASIPGVVATRVGYCGGHTERPTYHDVCHYNTGHAEAVEVTFESDLISYSELLAVFWECHDPTQINRQGPDYGEQYRSVIFFYSEEQRRAALASLSELESSHAFQQAIATLIQPADFFWEAESYHQKYNQKNRGGCGF